MLRLTFSLLMVLLAVLLIHASALASKRTPGLPQMISANLDRRFPGWHLALPLDELQQAVSVYRPVSKRDMCIASADFDGNGGVDYALFIQTGPTKYDTRLVVYLRRGGTYRHRTLERGSPSGEMYLAVAAKGTKDFNYTDDKHFVYDRPTLQFGGETGGYSYLFTRGRFRRVVTSD